MYGTTDEPQNHAKWKTVCETIVPFTRDLSKSFGNESSSLFPLGWAGGTGE